MTMFFLGAVVMCLSMTAWACIDAWRQLKGGKR